MHTQENDLKTMLAIIALIKQGMTPGQAQLAVQAAAW